MLFFCVNQKILVHLAILDSQALLQSTVRNCNHNSEGDLRYDRLVMTRILNFNSPVWLSPVTAGGPVSA